MTSAVSSFKFLAFAISSSVRSVYERTRTVSRPTSHQRDQSRFVVALHPNSLNVTNRSGTERAAAQIRKCRKALHRNNRSTLSQSRTSSLSS